MEHDLTDDFTCPDCGGATTKVDVTDRIPTTFGEVVAVVPALRCSACGSEWLYEASYSVREAAVKAAREARHP